jgi:hypothetical protein
MVGWIRGIKIIVDWHNLGYTLLQLTMRKDENHPVIKFSKWYFITSLFSSSFFLPSTLFPLIKRILF